MTYKEVIDNFLNHISEIKDYSNNTILAYKSDIEEFKHFIETKNMAKDLSSIRNDRPVKNYLTFMNHNEVNENSINRKLSALRSFYDFLVIHDIVSENYFKEIKGIKTESKTPKIIEGEKMDNLFKSIDTSKILGFRNYLILEMLFACGLRVSELCNIKVKDIDFINNTIKIFGKGNKDRIVIIYDSLALNLKKYISFQRLELLYKASDHNNKYLFLNNKGTTLTPKGIRIILNKILSDANESFDLSPQMLRHTFASVLINNGTDLRVVQELLGHENIKTTQIYTNINLDKMKESYDQAFTRNKKKE